MHSVCKRKNKSKPDRLEYLQLLVHEFQEVKSKDARRQVLANLANFAYDPYNYKYFRQLNILELFLTHISDVDEYIIQFAIGGLCNLCLDPENKEYILKNDGVSNIKKLLDQKNENIVTAAITTLMFLVTPDSKEEITSRSIVECMVKLKRVKNERIINLAQIFLEDFCTEEQVEAAVNSLKNSLEDIPLPDT